MKRYILILFAIVLSLPGFSQNEMSMDSLKLKLQTAPADSNRAILLYQLSREYWDIDLDTSIQISNELLKLSQSIDYKKGIGNAYSGIGVVNWLKGDYENALKYNKLALEIRKTL